MIAIDPKIDEMSSENVRRLAAGLAKEVSLKEAKTLASTLKQWRKKRRFQPAQWQAFRNLRETVKLVISALRQLEDPEASPRSGWEEANQAPSALWGGIWNDLEALAERLQ